jgi:hypothetical protein
MLSDVLSAPLPRVLSPRAPTLFSLFLPRAAEPIRHVTPTIDIWCCLHMAHVDATFVSAWHSQIGCKCVTVTGVPNCVVSGLPFSIRLGGADHFETSTAVEHIPPPPPDDSATTSNAVAGCGHQASSSFTSKSNTPVTVHFEARRVFFYDMFEDGMKWSCPPPASTSCEEPPPSALRFELRPLLNVGRHCAPGNHPHCLCVNGGFPNAKVDRNWVIENCSASRH